MPGRNGEFPAFIVEACVDMPGMEGSGNVTDAGNVNDGLGGAWVDRELMEPSGRILSLLW